MNTHQHIIEYLKLNGTILPAKMSGNVFMGKMFGSETSKRCRELRNPKDPNNPYGRQILGSRKEGRFEVFYLVGQVEEPKEIVWDFTQPEPVQQTIKFK